MNNLRVVFQPIEYTQIAGWRKAAFKEDAHLFEGKTPIKWYGAFANNILVGCIGLLQPYKSMTEVRIRGWYVEPDYRGMGVGSFLLIMAIEQARVLGYAHIEMKTKYREIANRLGFISTGKTYTSFGGQHTKPGLGEQFMLDLENDYVTIRK